jgi:formate dehydrogenase iron-sulfur subunit
MISGDPEPRTLIDDLLDTQQRLTAVERFAQKHEHHALPAQERYYRDLIPLNRPQEGEQYAFAVDLDACTGCKACVSACHSLNGLEDEELWRTVGFLHGGSSEEPYQQTITTACHHCVDPACANGCPVLAYEKDEETGIVRHLDDQCIGCQYCVLKCPYDVPKYSETKGIVRKCDMCQGRLAAGEAPACVQACPSGAIKIEIVRKDVVLSSTSNGARLIPGSFESSYTRPTTRFHSSQSIPDNARAADAVALRLEHPHWPLAIMLILTQLAAGVHAVQGWLLSQQVAAPYLAISITGLVALIAGMIVSFTHLGRPLKAWRAFLGLRRSWMSREIAAFSAYAGAASGLLLFPTFGPLVWGTIALGIISVACSAMIYIDTHRPFWAASRTVPKFFGTAALLGATTSAALFGWTVPALAPACAIAATVIRTTLFGWEWAVFFPALRNPASPTHRSALTLARLLRPILQTRVALFVASTLFSFLAIFNTAGCGAVWGTIAFVTTTASQLLERHTYFTASSAPRMPGGVPA